MLLSRFCLKEEGGGGGGGGGGGKNLDPYKCDASSSHLKSKWYKIQKVQKYALNSQLQALQILKNDDEVEN